MKDTRLNIRITPELLDRIDRKASSLGLTRTSYVTMVMTRETNDLDRATPRRKDELKMPKVYHLNEDWQSFEVELRAELKKLNATQEQTEAVLDGAWNAATEVNNVEQYAKDELALLSPAHGRYNVPVLLECGCEIKWSDGSTLWPGCDAYCPIHGDTNVKEIF